MNLKAIKSPFKMLFILMTIRQKSVYINFKQLSYPEKHFYKWQWNLLDRIYND